MKTVSKYFFLQMSLITLCASLGRVTSFADGVPPVSPLRLEGKMVCIGASITEGYEVKPGECYVDLLKAKVQAEHLNLELIGQGRGGWSTGAYVFNKIHMQDAMPADATIISILLGTNDSRESGPSAEVGQRAGENLDKLIDLYHEKAPKAQFIVVLPTKQYPQKLTKRVRDAHYGDSSAANIKEIAAAFKNVATRRGLLCIDLTALPSLPERSLDGIHPTAAGHREIFEAFWRDMIQSSSTTQP